MGCSSLMKALYEQILGVTNLLLLVFDVAPTYFRLDYFYLIESDHKIVGTSLENIPNFYGQKDIEQALHYSYEVFD